jgi:hypothetical protein
MTTDTAAPVRKPLTSRRFKIGMSIFAALGLLVLSVFVFKAHVYHSSFDGLGHDQVFEIQKGLVKEQPLKYVVPSISGTQSNSSGEEIRTGAKILSNDNYVYKLQVNDGYEYSYDSRTGFFSGTCTTLGCWVGLRQSA